MAYADLLKDPRWQKKRLEVMERDEWTCQTCGDTEATLTVHHKSYRMEKDGFADIWDYHGDDLITFCEQCHSKEEEELDRIKKSIYFDIRSLCENSSAMDDLLDILNRLSRSKKSRLNGNDFYNFINTDKNDLDIKLREYVLELSDEARKGEDRILNAMIDCCNFLLINGLYSGGHYED